MQLENLEQASWIVFGLGAILVIQSLFFAALSLRLHRKLKRMTVLTELWSRQARSRADQARQILERLESIGEKLPPLQERISRQLEHLEQALRWTDQMTCQGVERLRRVLRQGAAHLDSGLAVFSRQTFRVYRVLVHPAVEVSAVIQGIRTFFYRLLQWKSSTHPSRTLPEGNIFI